MTIEPGRDHDDEPNCAADSVGDPSWLAPLNTDSVRLDAEWREVNWALSAVFLSDEARRAWARERDMYAAESMLLTSPPGPILAIIRDAAVPSLHGDELERHLDQIIAQTSGRPKGQLAGLILMPLGMIAALAVMFNGASPLLLLLALTLAVAGGALARVRLGWGRLLLPRYMPTITAPVAREFALAVQHELAEQHQDEHEKAVRDVAESSDDNDEIWARTFWLQQPVNDATRAAFARAESGRREAEPPREDDRGADHSAERKWQHAIAISAEVRTAFMEWESDLYEQLFARPLLARASEPATAAFNDAFGEMVAQIPDEYSPTLPEEGADAALAIATAAQETWRAADKRARAVGIGELTDADEVTLRRAQGHLAVAADAATTDQERRYRIDKIIADLVGMTHRPTATVTAEVTQAFRKHLQAIEAPPLYPQLPAGDSR